VSLAEDTAPDAQQILISFGAYARAMPVKTPHQLPNELYFCTFTCCAWLPLFEMTQTYDMVYRWFTIGHEKRYRTCAFIIMPNHVHFIMATPFKKADLNTLVSNGKRFIAYEIVARLERSGRNDVLQTLSDAVMPGDRKRGKLHQIFRPSFDGKLILNEAMLLRKIDYIHHNPVSGKWHLVDDFAEYLHSSAGFYEFGKSCNFPITHYADILHGESAII
jgi:REP element-mobilizing transposase RayT